MTLVCLIFLSIFLVIGGAVGWLADEIMHDNGCIGDIVAGAIGSVIGGWLFVTLNLTAGSLIAAFVGAFALNLLMREIKRDPYTATPTARSEGPPTAHLFIPRPRRAQAASVKRPRHLCAAHARFTIGRATH